MSTLDSPPLINDNPSLQRYYSSLESRIGYRLVLGGTRHFGFYATRTQWPFPISRALRAMEDHLFDSLNLLEGATVLDAGCGVAHVAIHLARRGLHVTGIDVLDHHLRKAQKGVHAAGLDEQITLRKMDYHHLDGIPDGTLDGAYTMETLVHATDPERALRQFFRVLKPGGTLALYEYDHVRRGSSNQDLQDSMDKVNDFAAMPANVMFDEGVLARMLADIGFTNIHVRDLSANIEPMLRLFFVLAYFPYIIIRFFGLEKWFINTVAGAESYRGRKMWRYVSVTCNKPGNEVPKRNGVVIEDKKAR